MIINLWSTPRTGSVWYSMYLGKLHGCKVITELFNPYHLNIYRTNIGGLIRNYHYYDSGFYWDDYGLDNSGILIVDKRFNERTRTIEQELQHRQYILENMSTENRLVLHNHVMPIDPVIREYLTNNCRENIYIYRKDTVAQLASYAVAFVTKVFAKFTDTPVNSILIDTGDLPVEQLRNLVERIKVWRSLDKNGRVIAYEEIDFIKLPGLPVRQLSDYTNHFTDRALDRIREMAGELL